MRPAWPTRLWFAVAVCVCWLAAAITAAPAQDAALAAALPDPECQDMLLKVEQLVIAGHAALPPQDSALRTWEGVARMAEAATPGIIRALTDFSQRVRRRAAEEKTAGEPLTAIYLNLFGDMAEDLLVSSRTRATASSKDAIPTTETAAPTGVMPRVNTAAPTQDAPSATTREEALLYAKRGDAMMALKDVSAARKFYEFAANSGNGEAALALARTFDPGYLKRSGVVGLQSDPALALAWYRRAAALGESRAQALVQAMEEYGKGGSVR